MTEETVFPKGMACLMKQHIDMLQANQTEELKLGEDDFPKSGAVGISKKGQGASITKELPVT